MMLGWASRRTRTQPLPEQLVGPVAQFLASDPNSAWLDPQYKALADIVRAETPVAARVQALAAVQDHLVIHCDALMGRIDTRGGPGDASARHERDDIAFNVWVGVCTGAADPTWPPPDPITTGTRLAPLLVAIARSGSPEIRRLAQELVLPPGHCQTPVIMSALADLIFDESIAYLQGESAGPVAIAIGRWRSHHDPAPFNTRLVTRIQAGDRPTSPLLLTRLAERGVISPDDVRPCRDQLLTYSVDLINQGGAELLAWLGA